MIARRRLNCLIAAIAPALMLSGCGREPQLRVDDAVVKLSPVDSNPSALYFTVHGGPAEVALVSINSRSAIRAEMHESSVDPKSGMMAMDKINRVAVPADGKVEFKRGGKHGMLWGINLPARRLEKIEVEFLFSNNDRILVEAPIEKITADDASEHSGH